MLKNKWIILVIICLTTLAIIGGDAMIAPITQPIAEEYGFAQSGFMGTTSALVNAVFVILCGIFLTIFNRKTLTIASMAFFVIIGTIAIILSSAGVGTIIPYIMIFALCGAPQGMLTVLNASTIKEHFSEDQRAKAQGFYTASIAIMAIVVLNAGGFLAVGGMFGTFKIFLLAIPILAALFFIPKANEQIVEEKKEKFTLNKQIFKDGIKLWILVAIFQMIYQFFFQFLGLVFAFKTINVPMSMAVGFGVTPIFIGVLIAGFIFGLVYKKLQEKTVFLNFVLATAGLGIIFFAPNLIIVGIGTLLLGAMYCFSFSYGFLKAGLLNQNPTTMITITSLVMALSAFAAPHIFNLIALIFSMNHLQILPIIAGMTAVGAALNFRKNKQIIAN